MKRNDKKCKTFIAFLIAMAFSNVIHAKYIFIKDFKVNINSPKFFIEAKIDKNFAELDFNKADFFIDIQNYISESEYNEFNTTYEIVEENEKIELEIKDTNNGIIASGLNNNEVAVTIKVVDMPNFDYEENIELKVNVIAPYKKEIIIPLTVINSNALIGKYVNYDVAYEDIFTKYKFTKDDGWRILDPGTKNSDGTYSNTKLVTTGVPMEVYYNSDQNPGTASNANSKWWGTAKQVNQRYGLNLSSWESGKSRYFAAYGLEFNFKEVPASQTTSPTKNKAGYVEIINSEAPNTTTGSIFLNNYSTEVHAVTVEEMNTALNKVNGNTDREDRTLGTINATIDPRNLFYLRALNKYDYSSSTTPPYWLGSPNDNNTGLIRFQAAGTFAGGTDNTYGVRPVVVLNVPIYEEKGIWKIKEQ